MITLDEQIREAQRELMMRRKVYPRQVKAGKLSSPEASHQIQVMQAIVQTLMRLDAEQRQMSLFAE
jgi:hypothetical protein